MRATRWAAIGAVAALTLVQGVSSAAEPLRLTKPVQATKDDLNPGRTYSAPTLLVRPSDPKVIVGGYGDMRTKGCGAIRSNDGGVTWKIVNANVNPTSYPFCLANNSNIYQSTLAWGRDEALYMAMVAWDAQDTRTKASVALAKSSDLGDTWTTTLVRDVRPTSDTNQESLRPVVGLAVDSRGSTDVVYVAYRRSFQNQVTGNAKPGQPAISVSTDGGKTFGEPLSAVGTFFTDGANRTAALTPRTVATVAPGATSTTTLVPAVGSLAATPDQEANFGGTNQGVVVDNKGNVYVLWRASTSNVTPTIPGQAMFVSKTSDQGKTWTVYQVSPFVYNPPIGNPRFAWSPKGGSEGTLHMVYEGSSKPDVTNYREIYDVRSTDGGKTWSQPKLITDDDQSKLAGKYIPWMTVAPNGRLDVAWWDTRDDPGIRANDVYYAYSNDNGETWSKNYRVTDQTIDRRFGVWGNNFDQNSPPSLASTNQYALIGWDDTRFSRGDAGQVIAADPVLTEGIGGGVQDIFISAVQFTAIGGGTSSAAKGLLAGVVGLVAVGLVLMVVVGVGRRGSGGGAPSTRTVTGRSGRESAGVS